MPMDARGDGRSISADRKEHSNRRIADRRISSIESECEDSHSRGWRCGFVGVHGHQPYLAQKYEGPMHCVSPKVLGLAAQWSFWAMLEMEGLLLDLLQHRALLPEFARDSSYAERDELLLRKPLEVLNNALSGRDHLVDGNFTVADLNLASILVLGKMGRLDLSAHLDVARWLDSCLTRPACRRLRDRTTRK